MVVFNLSHGQIRAEAPMGQGHAHLGMQGYAMVRRPKPMVKWVQLSSSREADHQGRYYPDDLGNIIVTKPADINTMAGLGWPIYDGPANQQTPVADDQLLWADTVTGALVNQVNPFERKILESLKAKQGA